jgi:DNA-binding transcriptional ArsR family regulator
MVTHRDCNLHMEGLGPVLRAIADPTRRQILDLLAEHDLPVNRIADRFSITRWAIMKHLRVLRSAKLISVRRSGQKRIQCFNAKPLKSVEAWISRFASLPEASVQRLKPAFESDSSKTSGNYF